jgi:hypothetical protein
MNYLTSLLTTGICQQYPYSLIGQMNPELKLIHFQSLYFNWSARGIRTWDSCKPVMSNQGLISASMRVQCTVAVDV